MARRLDKTLADYVVGGVMPALLMGLLMSLCFFLLELAYSGAFMGQLKWILFFFIVGTVLIARISMRGDISERAGLYGIGLAIAAGLAMVRFVDIPPSALGGFGWLIPFSLMSIIWWSAHKLTQDSTWDDEDEEDGGGLLDKDSPPPDPALKSKSEEWFNQYQQQREDEQRRKKPGLMVVYFSLAALPLFGVGQAMIPATNIVGRRYAFWMLTIYVACGLGMLLTTSFLGLRRYLRGRRLQMPASMTALWLGLGAALILTLMVLSAVLLPRPEAEYHLSQWFTLSSKERDANSTHFFEGSSGKSDQSGPGPENKQQQQQGGKQAQQGNKQGNQQQRNNRQQQGQPDRNAQAVRAGNKGSDQQNQGQNQGQGKQQSQGKQSQGKHSQGEQSQGDQSNSSEQNNQSGKSDRSNGKSSDKRQGKNASSDQGDKQQGDKQSGDKQGESGDSSQDPSQQGREGNQGDKNEKRDKRNAGQGQSKQDDQNEQGNQGEQQQEAGAANSPPPPPPPPPQASETPSASWDWLKWLFYALLLAGILFALWKWGRQLWNGLVQFWKEILAWWNGLFPAQEKAKDSAAEVPDVEANLPPKPFAWFSNPLLNPGNFRSMEEMIRYSFAALHSWAYENRLARQPDETPLEFAQRLGQSMKYAHQDIRKLTDLYAVVTYANKQAPASSEAILRNFWNRIHSLDTVS